MKKHLLTLLLVLGLSAAVALAQATPGSAQSGSSGNYPAGSGANNPDQMGQSSAPMSEQQPGTSKDRDKDKKSSSMANVDDETLHRQVHEQLASNPDLQNVQITVKDGVVTLDGTVPNKDDRKQAKKLAKSVPGVRSVKEHLTISSSASAAAPSSTGGISGQTSGAATSTENQPSSQASTGAAAGQAGANTSTGAAAGSEMGQAGATSSTTGTTSGMGQTSVASSASPCSSMSSQTSTTGAATSGDLASQIQSEICKDPTLASSNISVSQQGNQIILSGTVPSNDVKDKASDIAMRHANGMSLVNNIQVSGAAGAPPSTAGGISGSVGGAAPSSSSSATGAGVSGQAGASTSAQPSVSGQAGVGAQTPESGASGATGATAGAATSSQTGTSMSSADEQLRTQIETALRQEPTLSSDNINVNLTSDSVELSGTVANGKDRQTAKRIAESFAGNRKVVDHLTVSGQGSQTPPNKQ